MFSSILALLLAYLIGAVSPSVIYSRSRSQDVRDNDFAGTSGMMRQFGVTVGVVIMLLDIAKGALATFVAGQISSEMLWFAPSAATLGHCYPVWHGFKGGQGIAPACGALTVCSSLIGLTTMALGAFFVALHRVFKLKRLVRLGGVPFSAVLTLGIVAVLISRLEGTTALNGFLLMLAVLLVRGAQVLLTSKPGS